MQKPSNDITGALWERVRAECEHEIAMFINNGVRSEKGKTKKETLIEVLVHITKNAYVRGVEQGYDMGHTVFGQAAPGVGKNPEER